MKNLLIALVAGVCLLSATESARAQGLGLFGRNRTVYVESPYYYDSSYYYPAYYSGSYYYPTTSSWSYPTRTYVSYYTPSYYSTPSTPTTTYSAPSYYTPSGTIQSAAYVQPAGIAGSQVVRASAVSPQAMPMGNGPIMKEAPAGAPAPTNQPPEGLSPQQDASPVTIPGYDLYFQNGRYYHVKK